MDYNAIGTLITNLGFPIVCVIGLAWFITTVLKKINEQNQQAMEQISADGKEREERLFSEIKEVTTINGKFAEIISKYDVKLDNIQKDVEDIKQKLS